MIENTTQMTNIIDLKSIIIYLIVINLITFFAMWIDKRKAKKNKWRISEPTLLGLGLIGGSIGGLLGMYTFRHKTKKARFKFGYPVIIALHIITYILFFKF